MILNVGTALATCRGDPALARALVEQYRASLPTERAALERARAATPPDWEAIGNRVHRLQSGGGYLGAERIAAAARALEAGILARDATATLTAAWRTLERAFEEFLTALPEEWDVWPRVVNRPSVGEVR